MPNTSSKTLKVCHVIHQLAPGGAEHLLVGLAEVAATADLEICVVSLMPFGDHPYPRELAERGVDVRSLDLPSRWDARGLARGVGAVEALAPDVLHTHLKHADLIGAYAASRLDLPMVSTLHLIEDAPTSVGRFKRWSAAQARLRRADRTIAVSDALRRWYLATFRADPGRVVTIHNGVVDPGDRRRAGIRIRNELGLAESARVAAMVGIMRPGKGHAELIAAASRIERDVDLRFLLVGDGELRHELEAQVAKLGVADRVVFVGFREDVPDVIAAADFLVHPSLFDALPTSLIFGLAMACPAVASDVGGIPEIVTPDVGRLVRPGDVDALAYAVEEMARSDDERRRLGSAARARFEADFEACVWAGKLRSLYDEVRNERAAPRAVAHGTGAVRAPGSFATTLAYDAGADWNRRAVLVSPTLPRNPRVRDQGLELVRVLRAAAGAKLMLLDSASGPLHPDLVACALIGLVWPRRRRPQIIMFGDMWQPQRGFKGLVQRLLIDLGDRATTRYTPLSREEIPLFLEAWGVGSGKLDFVPYFATLLPERFAGRVRDAGYVFAGGDSLRDYRPIVGAAREMPDVRFVLATSELDGFFDTPSNVEAGRVSEADYVDLLCGARIVVVPLRTELVRSTGHQTYLNSMLLAKPTVITDSVGVRDYVTDGENALVVDGSQRQYVETIKWLLDSENSVAVASIAEAGRRLVEGCYTFDDHVRALLAEIDAVQSTAPEQK